MGKAHGPLIFALFFMFAVVQANYFRSGTISWKTVEDTVPTIQFDVTITWQLSYFDGSIGRGSFFRNETNSRFLQVGDVLLYPGSPRSIYTIDFGDGTSSYLDRSVVTAIYPEDDLVTCTSTFLHGYNSEGTLIRELDIFVSGGYRLGSLKNAEKKEWRIFTRIRIIFGEGINTPFDSPIVTSLPVIHFRRKSGESTVVNLPIVSFTNAYSFQLLLDPSPLNWNIGGQNPSIISTTGESYLQIDAEFTGEYFVQLHLSSEGFSMDSLTSVSSHEFILKIDENFHGLCSCDLQMTTNKCTSQSDCSECSNNRLTACSLSNPNIISLEAPLETPVGGNVTFVILADDPVFSDSVEVFAAGLPSGATLSLEPCESPEQCCPEGMSCNNPQRYVFDWTVDISDVGHHIVCFGAVQRRFNPPLFMEGQKCIDIVTTAPISCHNGRIVSFDCNKRSAPNLCQKCECDPGFEIDRECRSCQSGHFGPKCEECPACENGMCSDGITGTGQCMCYPGFTGLLCDTVASCNSEGQIWSEQKNPHSYLNPVQRTVFFRQQSDQSWYANIPMYSLNRPETVPIDVVFVVDSVDATSDLKTLLNRFQDISDGLEMHHIHPRFTIASITGDSYRSYGPLTSSLEEFRSYVSKVENSAADFLKFPVYQAINQVNLDPLIVWRSYSYKMAIFITSRKGPFVGTRRQITIGGLNLTTDSVFAQPVFVVPQDILDSYQNTPVQTFPNTSFWDDPIRSIVEASKGSMDFGPFSTDPEFSIYRYEQNVITIQRQPQITSEKIRKKTFNVGFWGWGQTAIEARWNKIATSYNLSFSISPDSALDFFIPIVDSNEDLSVAQVLITSLPEQPFVLQVDEGEGPINAQNGSTYDASQKFYLKSSGGNATLCTFVLVDDCGSLSEEYIMNISYNSFGRQAMDASFKTTFGKSIEINFNTLFVSLGVGKVHNKVIIEDTSNLVEGVLLETHLPNSLKFSNFNPIPDTFIVYFHPDPRLVGNFWFTYFMINDYGRSPIYTIHIEVEDVNFRPQIWATSPLVVPGSSVSVGENRVYINDEDQSDFLKVTVDSSNLNDLVSYQLTWSGQDDLTQIPANSESIVLDLMVAAPNIPFPYDFGYLNITVTDSKGDSDFIQLFIAPTQNNPPSLEDCSITEQDGLRIITISAADSDGDQGDHLTLGILTPPTFGRIVYPFIFQTFGEEGYVFPDMNRQLISPGTSTWIIHYLPNDPDSEDKFVAYVKDPLGASITVNVTIAASTDEVRPFVSGKNYQIVEPGVHYILHYYVDDDRDSLTLSIDPSPLSITIQFPDGTSSADLSYSSLNRGSFALNISCTSFPCESLLQIRIQDSSFNTYVLPVMIADRDPPLPTIQVTKDNDYVWVNLTSSYDSLLKLVLLVPPQRGSLYWTGDPNANEITGAIKIPSNGSWKLRYATYLGTFQGIDDATIMVYNELHQVVQSLTFTITPETLPIVRGSPNKAIGCIQYNCRIPLYVNSPDETVTISTSANSLTFDVTQTPSDGVPKQSGKIQNLWSGKGLYSIFLETTLSSSTTIVLTAVRGNGDTIRNFEYDLSYQPGQFPTMDTHFSYSGLITFQSSASVMFLNLPNNLRMNIPYTNQEDEIVDLEVLYPAPSTGYYIGVQHSPYLQSQTLTFTYVLVDPTTGAFSTIFDDTYEYQRLNNLPVLVNSGVNLTCNYEKCSTFLSIVDQDLVPYKIQLDDTPNSILYDYATGDVIPFNTPIDPRTVVRLEINITEPSSEIFLGTHLFGLNARETDTRITYNLKWGERRSLPYTASPDIVLTLDAINFGLERANSTFVLLKGSVEGILKYKDQEVPFLPVGSGFELRTDGDTLVNGIYNSILSYLPNPFKSLNDTLVLIAKNPFGVYSDPLIVTFQSLASKTDPVLSTPNLKKECNYNSSCLIEFNFFDPKSGTASEGMDFNTTTSNGTSTFNRLVVNRGYFNVEFNTSSGEKQLENYQNVFLRVNDTLLKVEITSPPSQLPNLDNNAELPAESTTRVSFEGYNLTVLEPKEKHGLLIAGSSFLDFTPDSRFVSYGFIGIVRDSNGYTTAGRIQINVGASPSLSPTSYDYNMIIPLWPGEHPVPIYPSNTDGRQYLIEILDDDFFKSVYFSNDNGDLITGTGGYSYAGFKVVVFSTGEPFSVTFRFCNDGTCTGIHSLNVSFMNVSIEFDSTPPSSDEFVLNVSDPNYRNEELTVFYRGIDYEDGSVCFDAEFTKCLEINDGFVNASTPLFFKYSSSSPLNNATVQFRLVNPSNYDREIQVQPPQVKRLSYSLLPPLSLEVRAGESVSFEVKGVTEMVKKGRITINDVDGSNGLGVVTLYKQSDVLSRSNGNSQLQDDRVITYTPTTSVSSEDFIFVSIFANEDYNEPNPVYNYQIPVKILASESFSTPGPSTSIPTTTGSVNTAEIFRTIEINDRQNIPRVIFSSISLYFKNKAAQNPLTLSFDAINITAYDLSRNTGENATLNMESLGASTRFPKFIVSSGQYSNSIAILETHRKGEDYYQTENTDVQTQVFGLSLIDEDGEEISVSNSEEPISIVIPFKSTLNQTFIDALKCLYWDETQQGWSDAGCTRGVVTSISIECLCTHLTNFSSGVVRSPPASSADHNINGDNPSKSNTVGIAVGVVIGCLVLIVIIIVVIVVVIKRKNKKKLAEMSHVEMGVVNSDSWEKSNIQFDQEIGKGAFSVVYKATDSGMTTVAVKKHNHGLDKAPFIKEMQILKTLHHPNIVQFLRFFEDQPGNMYMVLEYIPLGNLSTYLQNNSVKPEEKVKIANDIVAAMRYLEENGIVHCDLAARNILLREDLTAKLSDFGMARESNSKEVVKRDEDKFSVRWASPEVLKSQDYSHKSDVWSFGIVLWEIVTDGKTPYGSRNNTEVQDFVVGGGTVDPVTELEFEKMIRKCVQLSPDARPKFSEIAPHFTKSVENIRNSVIESAAYKFGSEDTNYVIK